MNPTQRRRIAHRIELASLVLFTVTQMGCVSFGGVNPSTEDVVNDYYYNGYFNWDGATARVTWDQAKTSLDPGGPSDAARYAYGAAAGVGWTLKTNTGTDAGLIPVDLFESEPLSQNLYVNATRSIRIDLHLTTTTGLCTDALDVEILAGPKFLGGEIHGVPHPGTGLKAGYCVKAFRVHPELDVLEAGTVIKVKLLHHGELAPFQYGMAGEHRSMIRFPYYPPEEAVLRVPELVGTVPIPEGPPKVVSHNHGSASKPGSEPEASTPGPPESLSIPLSLGGLGAVGVAGFAGRPNRRQLVACMIFAVLLAMALSGCVGGKGESRAAELIVEQQIREQTGTILGRVQDESHFAVGGAHIGMLGPGNFTTGFSDSDGRFRFEKMVPGTWRVLVDKEGMVSIDRTVSLVAGVTTEFNVTMYPVVEKGVGFRPHKHGDEWARGDVLEIFNEKVHWVTSGQEAGLCVMAFSESASEICRIPFLLPDDTIIPPGTRFLDVKVGWDAQQTRVDRVGIAFRDNSDPNARNHTMMYPRGTDDVTRIATTWEMTDVGHQHFTTWQWYLYIPTNWAAVSGVPIVSLSQFGTKPFTVEITAHKGVIPLEPGHPDFWEANESMAVMKAGDAKSWSCDPGCYTGFPQTSFSWNPNRLVPPETRWLDLTLARNEDPNVDWAILYRPANVREDASTDTYSEYKKAPAGIKSGLNTRFIIPVEGPEPDAFYQKVTNWQFVLDDGKEGPQPYVPGKSMTFTLLAEAHKDPLPK